MEDVARQFITRARQFANNGCYSKAFDFYITAFEKCSSFKYRYEHEFRNVATRLNEVLAQSGRTEEIFSNFARMLAIYPSDTYLFNDIGKYLYKYGFYAEAWVHFQNALHLDSRFVGAEKNLNSVKNVLLERWHYRMLNDTKSNQAYQKAIAETIRPFSDSVVEVGASTCLLSLFAYKHHPIAVTAVESSEIIAQLNDCITQGMGIIDIIIVNKEPNTTDFKHVGGKRSLLVTQMFDAGLLGENILQVLDHAWKNLISTNGRVLPKSAEFFIIGANCNRLYHKYQLSANAKDMLQIPDMTVYLMTLDEKYDFEDVNQFKDMEYMTDSQSVVKVDFNDPNDIKNKLTNSEPYRVKLTAKKSGIVNTYIGWFNLHLTDTISITTNPLSSEKATAWQQAVFFDTIFENVKPNQTIDVDMVINAGKLGMVSDHNRSVVRVTPETLRFLNDPDLTKLIYVIISVACVYLGQMSNISEIDLIDLCPFPLFGLFMLKRGAQSLICYAKTANDERFFKKVFNTHNIDSSKYNILVGQDWTSEVFGTEKYHAIFANILDQCGDVDVHQRELALHLKESHLLQGGLFLPSNVTILAQVVSSKWLDINNHVYNENACGYDVAEHINKFQVTQTFFVDFTNLEYTPLTDPVEMGSLVSLSRSETVTVPVTKAGEANAILCWYDIEVVENMDTVTTKRAGCFTDGTAFLTKKVGLTTENNIKLIRVSDPDGSYKISFEIQTT